MPTNPPDGWIVTQGTWGSQVTAVGGGYIGPGGISLSGTCAIVSDWISLDTNTGVGYVATACLSPQSGPESTSVSFVQYQKDKTTVVATTSLWNSTVGPVYGTGAANMSVQVASVSNAPFGRWEISTTASVILWQMLLERVPTSLFLVNPTGTFTAANYGPVSWVAQKAFESGLISGNQIALRRAGLYLFTVNLQVGANVGSYAAGSSVWARIYAVNPLGGSTGVTPDIERVTNASETKPYFSFSHLVNVPSIANPANYSAFIPYYQLQINPGSVAGKALSGSLSVVFLH